MTHGKTDILPDDSAGDTSQRCDKAPAQSFSREAVLSNAQLLGRLASKGIEIDDEASASVCLDSLGYTHVSRYVPAHLSVVGNPSFGTLYRDILCDHAFQGALLGWIIQFERSFKAHLANSLAQEFGEFAHLEGGAFKDEGAWRQFVDGSRSELVQKARKGSRYAARIASMGRRVPIWHALEFSSLGTVSKFYANLAACGAKRGIAAHYGLDTSFVESWLASLSFVRNECAHGGVLYGRELEIQPRAHRLLPQASNRHAFYQVLLLAWLLERDIAGSGEKLASELAPPLSRRSMRLGVGAPKDWADGIESVARMAVKTCNGEVGHAEG